MEFIRPNDDRQILAHKKVFLILSGALLVISIGSIALNGLHFGIDFSGGTEVHVKFSPDIDITSGKIRESLGKVNLANSIVQQFGDPQDKEYLIRVDNTSLNQAHLAEKITTALKARFNKEITSFVFKGGEEGFATFTQPVNPETIRTTISELNLSEISVETVVPFGRASANEYQIKFKGISEKIRASLADTFGTRSLNILRVEMVGPKVGDELRKQGLLAIFWALLFILVYIAIRFEFKFAPGAVVALAHDVLITVGLFSILKLEFNLSILAACLAIIGYSLNDTIVIYDRIRFNLGKFRRKNIEEVINKSLNQTLSRTVLTSLTTLIVTLSLYILGGKIIRDFAFALTIGVLVGTYSSLFIASPMILWIHSIMENRSSSKA